jgi:hypothetical protein
MRESLRERSFFLIFVDVLDYQCLKTKIFASLLKSNGSAPICIVISSGSRCHVMLKMSDLLTTCRSTTANSSAKLKRERERDVMHKGECRQSTTKCLRKLTVLVSARCLLGGLTARDFAKNRSYTSNTQNKCHIKLK